MFFCILHNWSSKDEPCPACRTTFTLSNMVINQKDAIVNLFDREVEDTELMDVWDNVFNLLITSKNQIEYLHNKFKETGSGNQVISQLDKMINEFNRYAITKIIKQS